MTSFYLIYYIYRYNFQYSSLLNLLFVSNNSIHYLVLYYIVYNIGSHYCNYLYEYIILIFIYAPARCNRINVNRYLQL